MFFCNLLYIYIFNNTVASRKCQITTAQDNRCLKLSQLQKAMSLKATLVGHVKQIYKTHTNYEMKKLQSKNYDRKHQISWVKLNQTIPEQFRYDFSKLYCKHQSS